MDKKNMQKIVPHLWFNTEAKEATEFYVDAFGGDSKVKAATELRDTPSGDVDTVSFQLLGFDFMAISAGPLFEPNPSISFMVNFDPSKDANARENLDKLWEQLSDGGKALMPLDEYPFSQRYGWIEDKYGVSWQLILTDPDGEPRPLIIPSLLFTKDVSGKAEEATDFYISVFEGSRRGALEQYPEGEEPDEQSTVMFTDFTLSEQWFTAMDGGVHPHDFSFDEGISLIVYCDTQEEINYFWEKLSAVPEAEQCGWLKDKYGVSWQIVPTAMNEMMSEGTPEQVKRVTEAFLKMKKFDLVQLQAAYKSNEEK